jgi:catechol 2,3-dioxygenase-like lactoylglutathione lyase family enzyme
MKIDRLLHVNIRCSPADLSILENFYENALGMKSGYRPDFGRPGAWLYHDDEPLIHINAHFPAGTIEKNRNHSGSVDHIAFKCTGSAEMRGRLVRNGIDFQEQNVENAGYQIFITDPVGTRLEFNFPNHEAPDTVAFRPQTLTSP